MLFTNHSYPVSFKIQGQVIKNKAIEIANSLIKMGYKEDVAEAIALSNAKLWAGYCSNKSVALKKCLNVHLVPHPEGWALIPEDASLVYFVFTGKIEALNKARSFAKNAKLKLYIHSLSGNISDTESFVVNRPVAEPEQQLSEVDHWTTRPKGQEKPSFVFENGRDAVRKATWLAKKSAFQSTQ